MFYDLGYWGLLHWQKINGAIDEAYCISVHKILNISLKINGAIDRGYCISVYEENYIFNWISIYSCSQN